ncbi:MAG TPA: TPM domain-containing protein [Euryarchaeota archaeon]|nr:TPM domain-containing protein [Euryarchaeota archaeon]
MRRRGFIFTLDALLSLVLVMVFVSAVVMVAENSKIYSTSLREQSKYIADDTLTTLRNVPIKDLVPPEVLEEWKQGSDPLLVSSLVNEDMSPLDITATYWAVDPLYPSLDLRHKAEVILGYILNITLRDYNYELLINNYTGSYLRKGNYTDFSLAFDVSPATLTLSGYKYNQTPRGYMARAYLTKATVTREELYGWFRVLAGADDGNNVLNITRIITLPEDADLISADGKFVPRYDTDWPYKGDRVRLYINGEEVEDEYGQINKDDLKDYLKAGDNIISLIFSEGGYDEIGSASGTTLYVEYISNTLEVEDPGLVKVYEVTSERTGIMYLFEMFVPGNMTSINMKFRVRNVGKIRLYYGFGGNLTLLLPPKTGNTNGEAIVEFTDSEIRTALNNLGITYENLSRMIFDFVVGFDAYYYNEEWLYEGQDYNFTAERGRRIYGYSDSYIKIDYISKTLITQYSIPLSVYFPYGDSRVTYNGRGLQVHYDLPTNASPWYADFWVGYLFSGSTTQELWENNQQFYSGPLGRYAIRVAYTRLYDWMMVPGQQNTFEIRMSGGGSYVRDGETRGIIRYFIEGYAGYGDVFKNLLQGYPTYRGYNLTYYYNGSSGVIEREILVGDPPYKTLNITDLNPSLSNGYAVDDAILRLFEKLNYANDTNPGKWREAPYDGSSLNPIDVDLPEGVKIVFADMGNVPTLFEPITVTLRVWREK